METTSTLLSWLIFSPLLFGLVALASPHSLRVHLRKLTLLQTFVSAGIATWVYIHFNGNSALPQLTHFLKWLPDWGINYFVSIDGISLPLVMLTAYLAPVAILGTWPQGAHDLKKEKLFGIMLMVLQTGLYGTFLASDIFLFYFFWEVVLIPLFFLIGLWGGENRTFATVKFFIYTMVGSLLMLVAILYMLKTSVDVSGHPSASFADLASLHFAFDGSSWSSVLASPQTWLFLAFALAFVIKAPMIPFHTWLPDTYMQSPTVTVAMAAVVLKLGTYGLLRIAIPFFPEAAQYFSNYFILLGVIGIVYGAYCAMAQDDLKKLIAYSSVSHTGFIIIGLFAFNPIALAGSLYQMVNHGIASGGLFLIAGFLVSRLHTQDLKDYGGLAKVVPLMAVAFMIMTLSSVAIPGTNGFVGEFPILLGTFQTHPIYALFAGTGLILGAVYALKAFQMTMFGPQQKISVPLRDLNFKEALAMIILTVFIFGIGFFPDAFFGKSHATLNLYSDTYISKVGNP